MNQSHSPHPLLSILTAAVVAVGIAFQASAQDKQTEAAQKDQPADASHDHEAMASEVKFASAVLVATEGSEATGYVNFERVGDKIRVTGKVTNLSPGKHGFHIHEYGDLRSSDGSAAGGHFAPLGNPHGAPGEEKRHVGDLGNIEANDEGVAEINIEDTHLSFEGKSSILGRGVVVHAGEDDLKSQPSGNAGDRVAVGVIGVIKSPEEESEAKESKVSKAGQVESTTTAQAAETPKP